MHAISRWSLPDRAGRLSGGLACLFSGFLAATAAATAADWRPNFSANNQPWQMQARRASPSPAADKWLAQTTSPEGEAALELVQSELRESVGDRVFFAAGSAEIGARSRKALIQQAAFLAARPGIVVVIEGHADEAGSPAAVMQLSDARAHAVATILVEAGLPRDRISARAFGRSARLADCDAPACAAQNRRAVTRVTSVPAAAPQSYSGSPPEYPRAGLGAGPRSMQR